MTARGRAAPISTTTAARTSAMKRRSISPEVPAVSRSGIVATTTAATAPAATPETATPARNTSATITAKQTRPTAATLQ